MVVRPPLLSRRLRGARRGRGQPDDAHLGIVRQSLRVVVNSVVFRSSGQDLTTTGTYTEMASRPTEPVLLGLAALAIRGRVKR
ncbi:hypothetical protein GCM10009576_067160 [Streptomyces rhizosphaericus]|uniref:PEP-CTERM protein-sorting domain-containing protein n=1 Tax=Streptomyces rhizosphaericus TaxID=114699 RepID=A0ABN1SI88_9ACTN